MRNSKYDRIADGHKAYENKTKNALLAFISGGLIGFIGELIIEILEYKLGMSRSDSSTIMLITYIFMASLFTALGFFDSLVKIFRCGLLIPITGFAHSMTSSSLDYKREGLIYGIGSNMFKLAGNVILYGVVSAFFLGIIRYLIGGGF